MSLEEFAQRRAYLENLLFELEEERRAWLTEQGM